MDSTKNEAASGASLSDAGLGADSKKLHHYCSFCGARDDDGIALMITSYEAKICDRCVRMCNDILTEKGIPITEAPNAKSEPTARLFAQVGSTDGLCHTGDK